MRDVDVVWAEPPPRGRGTRPEDPRRVAMKENPGRWLLWGRVSAAIQTRLRADGFETVMRNTKDGRCDLYARWPASELGG